MEPAEQPSAAKKPRREDRKEAKKLQLQSGQWDKCMFWVKTKGRVRQLVFAVVLSRFARSSAPSTLLLVVTTTLLYSTVTFQGFQAVNTVVVIRNAPLRRVQVRHQSRRSEFRALWTPVTPSSLVMWTNTLKSVMLSQTSASDWRYAACLSAVPLSTSTWRDLCRCRVWFPKSTVALPQSLKWKLFGPCMGQKTRHSL